MTPFLLFLGTNPVIDAYRCSDLFGKGIFIALFGLSILTWVLFFQKSLQNRVAKKGREAFFEALSAKEEKLFNLELSAKAPPHAFYALTQTLQQTISPMLNHQRSIIESEREWIEAHLHTTISDEAKKLKSNLFILATIVSLAPFLGLLGTVWGILLTCSELQMGALASSSQVVMGELSMALGTTVCGLVVAIPALIACNILKSRANELTNSMEDYAHLLLASLERDFGK